MIIAGGAGDNAAAACGMGALDEGQGFVSLGTSGVLLSARDGYRPAPDTAVHTFCHAIPGRWYQMGVMLSATDSLNWFAGITRESPDDLTLVLGDTLIQPWHVRYLPDLSGDRTPHKDADVRGCFTGLSSASSRDDLTRAVLEGVAFGLRDSFEALKSTDAKLEELIAIGGGTGSHYWLRLIATVLGVPVHLPSDGEFGAALGAARLAMVAVTGVNPDSVMTSPTIGETIEPEKSMLGTFDEAYHRFCSAYPLIKAAQ